MRWTQKAKIQKACALLPGGSSVYRTLQRRFGNLNSDPFNRIPWHADMVHGLGDLSLSIEGARCLEVGTGHVPIAPVAFYLMGAAEVVTVDLHRRIDIDLTQEMLFRLVRERCKLKRYYGEVVETEAVRARIELIRSLAGEPFKLFDRIGLHYEAPCDAASLLTAPNSFDLHFSITTLEHIHPVALKGILREAKRILRPQGVAAHLIDPSDHFAHQDPSINLINFLRFDERRWTRIAGNEYSYCNRLRAPCYIDMFDEAGLLIRRADPIVDPSCLAAVKSGFPVHADFTSYTPSDLCTTRLDLYAEA